MLVNGALSSTVTSSASSSSDATIMSYPNTASDLAAFLLSQNGLTETFFSSQLNLNDAATLFSIFAQQQQQMLLQRLNPATLTNLSESVQQKAVTNERKRSYPCTFQYCVLCQKNVHSSKLPCHIRQCHVAKPMFQCTACDFTSTYSKNNVKSHMVSLHGLVGNPISFMEKYATQVEEYMKKCFPNVRGRGRPMQINAERQSPISPVSSQSVDSTELPHGYANNTSASASNNMPQRKYNSHSHRRLRSMRSAEANSHDRSKGEKGNKSVISGGGDAFDGLLSRRKKMEPPSATVDVVAGEIIQLKPAENGRNHIGTSCTDNTPKPTNDECMTGLPISNGGSLIMDVAIIKAITDITKKKSVVPSNLSHDSRGNLSEAQCFKFPARSSRNMPLRNTQSRYVAHDFDWSTLSDGEVNGTVFSKQDMQQFLQRLDLAPFVSLHNGSKLLNDEQVERVHSVRSKIELRNFEIMIAIDRMDLDVLPVKFVDLIANIAPSAVDIQRFRTYEISNSVSSLSESEQFLLQLAKIERVAEKLCAMSHIGHFNEKATKLYQQLDDIKCAAKSLNNSAILCTLMQLFLTCGNLICGDFNAQAVKGYRASSLLQMCSFKFPASEDTLIQLVAKEIVQHFPDLKNVLEIIGAAEKGSNVNLNQVSEAVADLSALHSSTAVELHRSKPTSLISILMADMEPVLNELLDFYRQTRYTVISMLKYFGEDVDAADNSLESSCFFQLILNFCTSLHKHIEICSILQG